MKKRRSLSCFTLLLLLLFVGSFGCTSTLTERDTPDDQQNQRVADVDVEADDRDDDVAVTEDPDVDTADAEIASDADADQVEDFDADAGEPFVWSYEPGQTYTSESGYVEFIAGDTPIIITAPHGGYDEPDEIEDRTGTTVRDAYTLELSRELAAAFHEATGRHPHVVSLLMARTKLDANREIEEAAQGDPLAEQVWHEFHAFTEEAKEFAVATHGQGFYIDLHGHGHLLQVIELGYLLSSSTLREDNSTLDDPEYADASSIRALYYDRADELTFSELLRGSTSFGALLHDRGFPSVPSPDRESLAYGYPYFSGGPNTRLHGSRDGGTISGVQVEANQSIRFEEDARLQFAEGFAEAIAEFVEIHYGFEF